MKTSFSYAESVIHDYSAFLNRTRSRIIKNSLAKSPYTSAQNDRLQKNAMETNEEETRKCVKQLNNVVPSPNPTRPSHSPQIYACAPHLQFNLLVYNIHFRQHTLPATAVHSTRARVDCTI